MLQRRSEARTFGVAVYNPAHISMLTTGSRLGSYEVTALLGAGGMGEVYRAHDARLGRDVALKILPQNFASDAERLARFKREAQILAAITHPNIGAIFGLEDSTLDGARIEALVLELVEGQTLAERISEGAIAVEDALPIARQIAEASKRRTHRESSIAI